MGRRPRSNSDVAAAVKLGLRVQSEREQAGVSRSVLARRLGIAHSHLWKIERGKVSLSVERARAIARAIKIPLARLMGERSAA